MSVPYRGRKAYKEPQCEELHREISRMSEDLDALAEGLIRLEDEVSSLKPKKRGRPKKK